MVECKLIDFGIHLDGPHFWVFLGGHGDVTFGTDRVTGPFLAWHSSPALLSGHHELSIFVPPCLSDIGASQLQTTEKFVF